MINFDFLILFAKPWNYCFYVWPKCQFSWYTTFFSAFHTIKSFLGERLNLSLSKMPKMMDLSVAKIGQTRPWSVSPKSSKLSLQNVEIPRKFCQTSGQIFEIWHSLKNVVTCWNFSRKLSIFEEFTSNPSFGSKFVWKCNFWSSYFRIQNDK